MTILANGSGPARQQAHTEPPMGELVWELEDALRPWTGVLPSVPADPMHVWRLRLRAVEEVVQTAKGVSSEQQAEVDGLHDRVDELEAEVGELESDLEAARSEQEDAEAEAERLQQRVEELEAEAKQLRARIGELELAESSPASSPAATSNGNGVIELPRELPRDRVAGRAAEEVSVR